LRNSEHKLTQAIWEKKRGNHGEEKWGKKAHSLLEKKSFETGLPRRKGKKLVEVCVQHLSGAPGSSKGETGHPAEGEKTTQLQKTRARCVKGKVIAAWCCMT